MSEVDPARVAERLEEVLDRLDPRTRPAGEELVRVLMQFYGAGLAQLVAVARAAGGEGLVRRLAADPLVGAVLALHDLHPVDLRTRAEHAMAVAARKLGGHAGDVSLLGIDPDGTIRVQTAAGGCGAETVRQIVAEQMAAAAPDAGLAFVEREPGPTLLRIGVRRP
ncbi:hypothetical protein [Pseudonocardia xishanensis]|uniref:NifU family protein n=1 Tax=Pseudonocardia xishanensis TaxID=630995 RepID=A0ABP8S3A8_9PSEU